MRPQEQQRLGPPLDTLCTVGALVLCKGIKAFPSFALSVQLGLLQPGTFLLCINFLNSLPSEELIPAGLPECGHQTSAPLPPTRAWSFLI